MQRIICFNIFFFLSIVQCVFSTRLLPPTPQPELTVKDLHGGTRGTFSKLVDADKGANLVGMSELKKYFHKFGYLNSTKNFTNTFDDTLEAAVLNYQKNLGLPVTGILDSYTITQIMSQRCGVPDHINDIYQVEHYTFFEGRPRWKKPRKMGSMTLTYAFLKSYMIDYISYSDIQVIFQRSFARWGSTISINFIEINDYFNANIKIAFLDGDHGDEWPFDGVLGVAAHAYRPEQGQLHLDKAETWVVDLKSSKSPVAVDLESIVTHEIGHILGLAHSSFKESIMYPYFEPRTRKVDLTNYDIQGIQELYGSNHNFRYTPNMETDNSLAFRHGKSIWVKRVTLSLLVLLVGFLF